MLVMASKIRIGDIIEIATQKGLAYAQYTHEHSEPPRFGSLIRVFSGFYNKRPKNFSKVTKSQTKFVTFVPLKVSVNLKLVTIVANEPVTSESQKFPVFRDGIIDPKTKKVRVWWFWDGKKEWKVGEITKEQKKMPVRDVVTIPCLIEQLESGWIPETDPYT